MCPRIVSYADSCEYEVVAIGPSSLFPPNGKEYFRDLKKCPYCSGPVAFSVLKDYRTRKAYEKQNWRAIGSYLTPLNLGRCSNRQCGWWALEQVENVDEIARENAEIIWGQVKIFDAASREVPIRLLMGEVKKNPQLVYSTHSDSFERLMTDCLIDKFPNSRVTHVGKSHDRGIDIFCIIDDEPCLVQVKRRKDGSIPEGPRAVRELNGVLLREGCYRGIFISTAERFTGAAFAELKIRMETAKPILVELIAFDGIVDLIAKSSAQYEPWKQHIVKL